MILYKKFKIMYPEQTRINAAISYFFLAPFFILSKKNSPFWEKFVQQHSKKATIIILFMIVSLGIIWFLKDFLKFTIIWFSIYQIIFSIALTFFFILLIAWSYQAFKWIEPWKTFSIKEKISEEENLETKEISEEEKIRIFMSFLPFLWEFLYKKYQLKEIEIVKKVSNFLLFLLFSSWYFWWSVNIISFAIIIFWIILAITTLVFLITKSQFLNLNFYSKIPSYNEIIAFLSSILVLTKEYILVAFGKEKTKNLKETFIYFSEKYNKIQEPQEKLSINPILIAIPFLNLIFVPILFQKKYREYRGNILQWVFLTILIAIIFYLKNWYLLYFLGFWLLELLLNTKNNTNINAPIINIVKIISGTTSETINKINELNNFEETEKINFNEK